MHFPGKGIIPIRMFDGRILLVACAASNGRCRGPIGLTPQWTGWGLASGR
jgi:hypothetical protein